ncbi:MAG: M23 family metallopeptidase [Balneolaceae bacterium]|nr:M23 family metallopeptidase [Balneolaceae bacterium]MBO6546309.1 M23 family metallopeptidase [Balneolaceae bacterium]MBO6648668.1 M23 family metallopeptidase [Balneolaceae bacterium]
MSLKNHYYYDESSCEFIPITYNRKEQVIYNLAIWILTGVVFAGIGIILLSTKVGSPAELALKAENEALYTQLEETKQAISNLDLQLEDIASRDNEVYRSILGLDEISLEERQAGIGGTDPYEEFDIYEESTADLLKWTASKIDNLERKIGIQNLSFEEIKNQYNNNKEKLTHIPAIKPGSGILLSGFGLRYHPILQYSRPHNGVDFRAEIGSPVYATGDGVVKYAGRKGNLGKIVVIDHGFGFETLYAHLSAFSSDIKSGTKVLRGQEIAKSGNTGLVEGPHLHYEVHLNNRAVDPLFYLFADTSPEEYMMFRQISETNSNSLD